MRLFRRACDSAVEKQGEGKNRIKIPSRQLRNEYFGHGGTTGPCVCCRLSKYYLLLTTVGALVTLDGVPNAAEDSTLQVKASQILACNLSEQILQTIFFLQKPQYRVLRKCRRAKFSSNVSMRNRLQYTSKRQM